MFERWIRRTTSDAMMTRQSGGADGPDDDTIFRQEYSRQNMNTQPMKQEINT